MAMSAGLIFTVMMGCAAPFGIFIHISIFIARDQSYPIFSDLPPTR
jgi:hypothetical protein